MKFIFGKTIFILYFFLFLIVNTVNAFKPGLPNNKFGIHFALPNLDDLIKTKELVNSNGGDWGYVTLVIPENDRDRNKWQEVFDKMRELHLIPIIRLATVPQGDKWRRPVLEDADSWVNFLNSLNWVIKDRYIVLFNEPNHGAEWGGSVDSEDYAKVALEFARKLKENNPDYFIMLAGLDASAPHSPPNYYEEGNFLSEVINNITIQQYNNLFSGLSSHSYPNPGFSASPYNSGKGSIRTYEWELNLLNRLGVKDIPVFITETGWSRGDESLISDYFRIAFQQVWSQDTRIAAVTPFIFDYQGEPFLNFSWKKFQSQDYYQQYYTVQSLAKVRGMPEQIEKGTVEFDFPDELVTQSSYRFTVKLRNQGQAVWDKDFGYQLSVIGSQSDQFEYFSSDLKRIKPNEEADVDLFFKTGSLLGKGNVEIVLTKFGEQVLNGGSWEFETFPLPSLSLKVKTFPKFQTSGDDFEVQVFNSKEELVFKKKNIKVRNGSGSINEVQNVALDRKYRIVILKPLYLPRQGFITFKSDTNEIKFERMLPLDFNPDGKLDFKDLSTLFTHPDRFTLMFP